MSKVLVYNQPCQKCGSSDAVQIYEDGAFCFSCQTQLNKKTPSISEKFSFQKRGISKAVLDFFGVTWDDNRVFFNYGDGGVKVREKLEKKFEWQPASEQLYGMHLFPSGKKIVICEGETDTLSVAQAYLQKYAKFYPVVGIHSATTAKKLLLKHRDYLRTFDEVLIAFDQDEPGNRAADQAALVIGYDKVKRVKFHQKDCNEVLLTDGYITLNSKLWEAVEVRPAGIVNNIELKDRVINYLKQESIPFPDFLSGMNFRTKGIRFGEISLFTSGTSCGKSTLMRELMLHFKSLGHKIGIVSLEESPEETALKLAAMNINKNRVCNDLTDEEVQDSFDQVFDDNILILDHQGSISDLTIIDKLEFMCLMGCKVLFIDHITILVSEGIDNLDGNAAVDKIMNELLSLCKRHNCWIGLVSHLRKTSGTGPSFEEGKMPSLDDVKGSGAIKQVAFDVFGFSRNLQAEGRETNVISLAVLKCRFTGQTGKAGQIIYNFQTGRMEAHDVDFMEGDE